MCVPGSYVTHTCLHMEPQCYIIKKNIHKCMKYSEALIEVKSLLINIVILWIFILTLFYCFLFISRLFVTSLICVWTFNCRVRHLIFLHSLLLVFCVWVLALTLTPNPNLYAKKSKSFLNKYLPKLLKGFLPKHIFLLELNYFCWTRKGWFISTFNPQHTIDEYSESPSVCLESWMCLYTSLHGHREYLTFCSSALQNL